MGLKFICRACGEACEASDEWTEDMARAEYRQNYPNDPEPDWEKGVIVVCDDCYRKDERTLH